MFKQEHFKLLKKMQNPHLKVRSIIKHNNKLQLRIRLHMEMK
jgi:hypothetical protein